MTAWSSLPPSLQFQLLAVGVLTVVSLGCLISSIWLDKVWKDAGWAAFLLGVAGVTAFILVTLCCNSCENLREWEKNHWTPPAAGRVPKDLDKE